MSTRTIALLGDDRIVRRDLERIAAEHDARLAVADEPPADAWVIVVDLAHPAALDLPPRRRERWPQALLAAYVVVPERARWEEALAAGYDLVASRGALARELARALASWSGPRTARRVRAVAVDDVAGRIGLVARVDDPDAGPLAVYHLGGALYATADACPHAGVRLSRGALEGAVVTCPGHGSQFDVRSGERLRGPADDPVRTYPVAVEGGVAFIEIDEG